MPAITADDALNASFSWALWKVLDYLSTRFLPGSLLDNPQRAARSGGPRAAGQPDGARDGAATQLDAALAALRGIDPAELQVALASLSDDNSPLVQCLAWSLGAPGLSAAQRQQRLDASLTRLSRAESFALLAILLWQAQTAGSR